MSRFPCACRVRSRRPRSPSPRPPARWTASGWENPLHFDPIEWRNNSPAASSSVSRSRAAIVHEPALLLFEQPLSNLDARLRDETRAEIRQLQRDLKVSTIYVTHDQTGRCRYPTASWSCATAASARPARPRRSTPARTTCSWRRSWAPPVSSTSCWTVAASLPPTPCGATFHRRLFDALEQRAIPRDDPPRPAADRSRPGHRLLPANSRCARQEVGKQRLFMGGCYEYVVETDAKARPRCLSPRAL